MHRPLASLSLLVALTPLDARAAESNRIAEVETRLLAEAKAGAEQHRKGDATVIFTREGGKPIPGRA